MRWWVAHLARYNAGLALAGLVAFMCYATVVWFFQDSFPETDITLFTIFFQGIAWLAVMVVANVCYFVGPLSEIVIKPDDTMTFRERAFSLGFWFSVALPFAIPVLAIATVVRSA